jgi:flagellar protein FliJ
MRFTFRLESLLELRRQTEKERQLAVAKVQQQIDALRRQIQQTQLAIAKQNRTLVAEKLVGRLDLAYIANEKRFVGNLQILIAQTYKKLVDAERDMIGVRAKLMEAAIARKVIEKLREKQFARWKLEQDRKEAATMDELGTQVALREMIERELQGIATP